MCGIVGAINGRSVVNTLIGGLRTLEYRGYDSAGVAIMSARGIDRRRASGKLDRLVDELSRHPLDGHIGIGHTRWATHGAPTTSNAHPHCAQGVAVVHNGIIENHGALRERLSGAGFAFESETDSEVIPKLIRFHRNAGTTALEATRRAVSELEGQFALVAMFDDAPDELLVARQDCPMTLGVGAHEVIIASDPLAFGDRADRIAHLGDGQIAVVRRASVDVIDAEGIAAALRFDEHRACMVQVSKGRHDHFMRKEIEEQPEAVRATLDQVGELLGHDRAALERLAAPGASLDIVACGTSYYAGMVGAYWLEELAGLPVRLDVASEFRYRRRPARPDASLLVISQSGETADTLASLRHAKAQDAATVAIVNVTTSSMAREADLVVPTMAGPEVGVASTKAFTAQLAALFRLALRLGTLRGTLSPARRDELEAELVGLPRAIEAALGTEATCRAIAADLGEARSAIFIGRGSSHPLALEGALKLKEISYIHAEGAAAGELKHGPLALIDPDMPVFVLAPRDHWHAKTLSNLQEVAARGGKVVLVGDAEAIAEAGTLCWRSIELPACGELLSPFVQAVALQLVAYHAAVQRGTDVDQPRNLAKSVTVE